MRLHKTLSMALTAPLLCLSLCLIPPQTASAQGPDPAEVDKVIYLSGALGKSFCGEAYQFSHAQVAFSRKVKPSGFLSANRARMAEVHVLADNGYRLTGTLTYADPLGREATYLYSLDYATLAPARYRIDQVGITTYEPLAPAMEAYFVPAEAIAAKTMQGMPTADLLAFARAHEDRVEPGAQPSPARDYHVLVFCMHRLRDGAVWTVSHNNRLGQSWSRGDWHVAAIDATVALNGTQDEIFPVHYGPGARSPHHGKLYPAGAVVSRALPAPWEHPATAPLSYNDSARLRKQFKARTLPNMAP
ncbi:hypothetical protein [uncultured Pseudodesulfovibrio sp.]|uniref:hypothetical protein n=1 Tax=uncultured Pseudodesulfovibrio sp. TaxID=2035858 RepID=UPI0029C70452|nr:hypothetical protein [uncultured Pseudodesulfovibrio sp.]